MSTCTTCGGTGTTPCPTCHGQGIVTRRNEDGEVTQRLCGLCQGGRQLTCVTCHGTGHAATPKPAVPAAPAGRPAAPADRLAGRWKDVEGTWYEFVPDGATASVGGAGYRVTAGGLRDVSATGTATLLGNTVRLTARDKLLGPYSLELTLRGNHLEGIDRKAGFPLPVSFSRV